MSSQDGSGDIPYLMRRKQEAGSRARPGFFTRRGKLDLTADTSGHRRYAWLYEDMLH